jgi:hypothetical protein
MTSVESIHEGFPPSGLYHAEGCHAISAQRPPDRDMREYKDILQNVEGRVFQKLRIHLMDANAIFQKLDVVRKEHDA